MLTGRSVYIQCEPSWSAKWPWKSRLCSVHFQHVYISVTDRYCKKRPQSRPSTQTEQCWNSALVLLSVSSAEHHVPFCQVVLVKAAWFDLVGWTQRPCWLAVQMHTEQTQLFECLRCIDPLLEDEASLESDSSEHMETSLLWQSSFYSHHKLYFLCKCTIL